MASGKRKNYHHGDLKNSLVEAGLELLRHQDASGISLRAVAKEIGVSHTAPYRHFKSKHSLLAAISQRGFEILTENTRQAVDKEPNDARQQLMLSGQAYVDMAVEHPKLLHLMFGGALSLRDCSTEYCQIAQNSFLSLTHILENGVSTGVFKDKSSTEMSVVVWSLLHGLAMLISAGQLDNEITSQKRIRELSGLAVDTLLNGLLK